MQLYNVYSFVFVSFTCFLKFISFTVFETLLNSIPVHRYTTLAHLLST